jgi:hypothetical protein
MREGTMSDWMAVVAIESDNKSLINKVNGDDDQEQIARG